MKQDDRYYFPGGFGSWYENESPGETGEDVIMRQWEAIGLFDEDEGEKK